MKALAGAKLQGWTAERCVGSYPLQVVASSDGTATAFPSKGDALVLTLSLAVDGSPWLGAAPSVRASSPQ